MPNIIHVSSLTWVDDDHVAMSRQFFKKTAANLKKNPRCCVFLTDAVSYRAFRLELRFLRSETRGPTFEAMKARIEAIAAMTGMREVFTLTSADIFRVEGFAPVDGYLVEGDA